MHSIRQRGHTPDPEGAARNLSAIICARVTAQDDRSAQQTSNHREFEIVYLKGDQPGVLAIGLEATGAAARHRRALSGAWIVL